MNTTAIATNMNSIRTTNIFNQNQTNATKAFDRVSTGLRIQNVAQGPADWAVSEKMRERINSLNQANQNIQNDTAMMKTAADGISNTVDILRTIKARVLNGANASSNTNDQAVLMNEVNQLLDQIQDNAFSISFNGLTLLDGTYSSSEDKPDREDGETNSLLFQVGDSAGTSINVNIGDLRLVGLFGEGVSFGTADDSGKVDLSAAESGVQAAWLTLAEDYDPTANAPDEETGFLSSITNAQDFMKAIDNAVNVALTAATNVGSLETRLGYTADNVATQIENLQASDSAIRDADMAQEISEYMKWNVLSQASQYMLAQSNQNAFSVLNLLQ